MFLSFDINSKEIKIISINNKYKIINNIKSYGLNTDKKKNIYLLNFENNQIVKINKDLKKITFYSSNDENIYEDKFASKIFKRKYKNQIINKPHSIGFLDEKIFLINLGDQKQNGNITVLNNKLKKVKTIKKYFNNKILRKPAMIFLDKDKKIFISDTLENKILIFDKDFNLINWIGSINKEVDENFKRKNLFNIDLNNPHGVNKFKQYLIICDTHNNRVIIIKDNKIYGWFENTSNNHVVFYMNNKKIYKHFNKIKNLNGPLDIAIYKNNIILTESYNNRLLKINLNEMNISEIEISLNINHKLRSSYEIKIIDKYIFVSDPKSKNIKILSTKNFLN